MGRVGGRTHNHQRHPPPPLARPCSLTSPRECRVLSADTLILVGSELDACNIVHKTTCAFGLPTASAALQAVGHPPMRTASVPEPCHSPYNAVRSHLLAGHSKMRARGSSGTSTRWRSSAGWRRRRTPPACTRAWQRVPGTDTHPLLARTPSLAGLGVGHPFPRVRSWPTEEMAH